MNLVDGMELYPTEEFRQEMITRMQGYKIGISLMGNFDTIASIKYTGENTILVTNRSGLTEYINDVATNLLISMRQEWLRRNTKQRFSREQLSRLATAIKGL